jgi:hypothetical protein
LISQHFHRPVTPEVAGSSPVAPAKDFNGLARIWIHELTLFVPPS